MKRFVCSLGLLFGLNVILWAETAPKQGYDVRLSSATIKHRQAALELGQSKDAAQAGPALLQSLGDKDPMTRMLAVQGLGRLKYDAAQARLSGVLASDPSPEVREAAAMSLRQIGDPHAVGALCKATQDSSLKVRIAALTSIGIFRDRKALPTLEAACKDPSAEVRRTATYALGRLGDPQAVPVVQGLLKDTDATVRAAAAQALGLLRSTSSIVGLQELLKDPNTAVQASAARSLAMLGSDSGLEIAKGLTQDPNLAVRLLAIDAFGWSKDPAAETELQALSTQVPPDSRIAVQQALLRHQH